MCGRFALFEEPEVLEELFGMMMPDLLPRYDIRPTDPVLSIAHDGASFMRWQLLPSWEKSDKLKYATFNARAEDAAEKPAFRRPFERGQRCLIPASGFYEWKGDPGKKRRYFFKNKEGLLVMAGLWDEWKRDERVVKSCTILTTTANDLVRPIHEKNRMPVILDRENFKNWLDPSVPTEQLRTLFDPRDPALMEMYEVDSTIRADSAALVEPLQELF